MLRRASTVLTASFTLLVMAASTAWACGFLVAENGAIRLDRFTALAAVDDDGRSHYVTSFTYAGEVESFGAVVPLPAEPTIVEKAGSWTLQRLRQEVTPQREASATALSADAAGGEAEVIATYEVEALDIAVLRGGAQGVFDWTKDNGFDIGVAEDAVEMLEFYAERSPYFAAVRYDVDRAQALDRQQGDGTPVHFAFEDAAPWVPLRVLAFDKPASERVLADVFLLTPERPRVLTGAEVRPALSAPASDALLTDLRDDENSGWVPTEAWLTHYAVDVAAEDLTYDLAVAGPGEDTVVASAAFGLEDRPVAAVPPVDPAADEAPDLLIAVLLTVAVLTAVLLIAAGRGSGRARRAGTPGPAPAPDRPGPSAG